MRQLFPGGVNSPARAFRSIDSEPIAIQKASGCYLYDNDDRELIDYCCAWGTLIAGHAPKAVVDAIREGVDAGVIYGLVCPLEASLAKMIQCHFPHMEQMRFVNSGTEATMSAVRLARGATGRHKIILFAGGYHGHADAFLVQGGSSLFEQSSFSLGVTPGAIQDTLILPYNDISALQDCFKKHGDTIAAILMEPIAANMGVVPATQAFIEAARQYTSDYGALLIFDEVVTGFRIAYGGAAEYFGVTPDLTCLAKILGGGLPIGAFGGSKALMEHLSPTGKVFQAGTFSGNPLSMRAGCAILSLLKQEIYQELECAGAFLQDTLEEALVKKGLAGCVQRVGSALTVFFGPSAIYNYQEVLQIDRTVFTQFFKGLLAKGILIPPSPFEAWFISTAHSKAVLEKTAESISQVIQQL